MIVITIEDIIMFILIGMYIIWIIVTFIKCWLDSIFKKNCYECKHWKFHSTHSYGDYCDYRCMKKDKIKVVGFSDRVHYEKCDDFEEKEVEKNVKD